MGLVHRKLFVDLMEHISHNLFELGRLQKTTVVLVIRIEDSVCHLHHSCFTCHYRSTFLKRILYIFTTNFLQFEFIRIICVRTALWLWVWLMERLIKCKNKFI